MKTLWKIQLIIPSDSGGPYGYRTRLGWCIVGPIMGRNSKGPASCHQAAVRDSSTSQEVSSHFGIKDSIKYIALKEIFMMMYRNGF